MEQRIIKHEYPEEIKALFIEGKNPDRVNAGYIKYPSDWKAQYNMLLKDGVTCKSCSHCKKCCAMFGQNETDTHCQFYPSRFIENRFDNPSLL